MSSRKQHGRSDPDRLQDKSEINRLVTEAQRILNNSTVAMVAAAIGLNANTLSQAIRRQSLAGEHRRALQQVIATGEPLPKAVKSDELNALRARLEESYASLGLRGRAQFTMEFVHWLDAHMPALRRLDHHIRMMERGRR
jgi:hypothetical protein